MSVLSIHISYSSLVNKSLIMAHNKADSKSQFNQMSRSEYSVLCPLDALQINSFLNHFPQRAVRKRMV